jgi:gas vesicle protein
LATVGAFALLLLAATALESYKQARDWIKAVLAAWAQVLDTGATEMKSIIRQTLKHWKTDKNLAGIRDEKELAKLSEDERAAFKRLWNDVDQLLAKAGGN